MPRKISFIERLELAIQWLLGFIVVLPLGIVVYYYLSNVLSYHIQNIKEIRRQHREILRSKKPTIICSNHLTMIDSIIMHWAFNSVWGYVFHYGKLSWNMPAKEVFGANWKWKYLTYLGKSLHIDRNGTREHHEKVLRKTKHLIEHGEPFTIFPEGGRTRTGRIDIQNVRYGVGSIIDSLESDCQVICVYMRGDSQNHYSNFPRKGENFYMKMDAIEPHSDKTGIRAHRELTMQIVEKLQKMEKEYFDKIDERKSSSDRK